MPKPIPIVGGPHDGQTLDFSNHGRLPYVWYLPVPTDRADLYLDDVVMWRPPDAVYNLWRDVRGGAFYKYAKTINYKP